MAPGTSIRGFEPGDEPEVTDLWLSIFAYPTPHNEPARVIRDKLRLQPELFFVAERDGRVVGTVMGGYDGHRGWIYAVAVREDLRRLGIGAALVRHAEAALEAMGCAKVNLQVRSDNDQVVAFYERLGYAVEARISMGKLL